MNRGRPPRYLTIQKFEEFMSNHFFHLKVELRVQSFVVVIILIVLGAVAAKVFFG